MTILDWTVIAAYFALLLGLTWWALGRNRDTADDYYLAGSAQRDGDGRRATRLAGELEPLGRDQLGRRVDRNRRRLHVLQRLTRIP